MGALHSPVLFVHYLTYLFFSRIVLTEKHRIIKTLEHDFYLKVIEGKCSGNVRLKTGYTFVEKRV